MKRAYTRDMDKQKILAILFVILMAMWPIGGAILYFG